MSERTKIFISYSHEDERWRKRLVNHLSVLAGEGILDLWDDRSIRAGEDWQARIREQMRSARIAILLVSSSFLTSRFICETEMPAIFDRNVQEGMTIYPLLIKPCPWQDVAWLARMQVRPSNARPLASLKGARVDEALVEVAREISAIARAETSALRPLSGAPAEVIAAANIAGDWQAEVTYDWPNAKYTEVFRFQVDGDDVLGTASFLGGNNAIWDGKLIGTKLAFTTKTPEVLGDWNNPRESFHYYRGRIVGNEIRFVMQTDGGYSHHIPIEFTARRVSPAN